MKELSIEEKAKAHDNSLEKARKWYDANTNEGYRAIFEDIFPELAESEDEKLRKWLIRIFKSYQNPKTHINPNEWEGLKICNIIAWLEKQKHEEWSLYDEKILSEVFTSVEIDAYSEEKKKEIISWLQKYRPCRKSTE